MRATDVGDCLHALLSQKSQRSAARSARCKRRQVRASAWPRVVCSRLRAGDSKRRARVIARNARARSWQQTRRRAAQLQPRRRQARCACTSTAACLPSAETQRTHSAHENTELAGGSGVRDTAATQKAGTAIHGGSGAPRGELGGSRGEAGAARGGRVARGLVGGDLVEEAAWRVPDLRALADREELRRGRLAAVQHPLRRRRAPARQSSACR